MRPAAAHAVPAAPTERAAHAMPFGAELRPDGSTRFRLWAPDVEAVALLLGQDGAPCPWSASTTAGSAGP